MELRTSSVNFPSIRGNGPITQTAYVHFPRDVKSATAGIIGYSAGFSGKKDHDLGSLQLKLESEIDGDLVKVVASFGLRDWSGNWDDDYEGNIQFVVVGELANITDPRPRGDLVITGMELNQATQHFRSSHHLDNANVRPDNSIPLIARKDTAVRVYIDYDNKSGLPIINTLTGQLIVNTGFTTITLNPENLIRPKRDNQIDRGNINDTLNFIIPETFCENQLTLQCTVFDASNPIPASRIFEKTIEFENRVPLSLYAVGVHYTGQSLDLPAPTVSDIIGTSAFSRMEVVYPVPEVLISGYTEIEFSKDMKADINSGCGDGYKSLLDTLRDMQGGSSDVYYGFLPNGFNGGSVGGCGGGSGRVAASPYTNFGGLAQETGHAFDRKHAICDDSTRCGTPANQDSNYPKYADFASDSIGEYGYNPRTNVVFTPLNTYDFMSYSFPQWVSPYTYMALLGAFPSSEASTAFMLQLQNDSINKISNVGQNKKMIEGAYIKAETTKLFLWLEIDRKRNVTRLPSFHFNTKQVNSKEEDSGFTVELVDENGKTLTCQGLMSDCANCEQGCFPKSFRQYIPYLQKARKLIIYENDNSIYEEEIVEPQDHHLKGTFDEKKQGFFVEWRPAFEDDVQYWYLIHWQDVDGQWRGLSEKTTENSAFIPVKLLGRRLLMPIRLLCSTGIATIIVEDKVELSKIPKSEVQILITGDLSSVTNRLSVTVIDNNRVISNPDVYWYNDNHQEIGKGKSISLNRLVNEESIVYAVALHNASRYDKAWIVKKQENSVNICECAKKVN